MDRILNRICSIENHPFTKLDEKFRIQYVKGLVACMYSISQGSDITKMITFAWVQSILPANINFDALWKSDLTAIKNAISLKRKGIIFFYMRESFFFDVFYLAQASLLDNCNLDKIHDFLSQYVCGLFSKRSLNNILLSYKQNDPSMHGVSSVQISHRNTNNTLLTAKEKRILVVANVSAGKSTLINSLVGYRLNRTKTTACTDKLVYLHNKCSKDGITSKRNDGKYSYSCNIDDINSDSLAEASLPYKSTLRKEHICLIDTPGMNNADDSSHKQITEDFIIKGNYDVVIYVSNCQYFGTDDEHKLLKFLKANTKKPVLFVLNQLDVFNPQEDSINKMLNEYRTDLEKLGFRDPEVIPVSAYASFLLRIDSSYLTRIEAVKKNNMIELFKDDYYNLPQYIGQGCSSEILDKTGIKILENKIITV